MASWIEISAREHALGPQQVAQHGFRPTAIRFLEGSPLEPLVSVIIAAHNSGAWLTETIDSVPRSRRRLAPRQALDSDRRGRAASGRVV
jgi:hypothetical protein